MMWNWRMLGVTADARFADVMERALYNGINSGISLSGTLYCYRNPLESAGEKIRNEWYDTTCCPPNIERVLASLPGYFYNTSSQGLYVNFYGNSHLDWHLENGTALQVDQKTGYPWSGSIAITVTPAATSEFSVFLRAPGWSRTSQFRINGKAAPGDVTPGRYFEIHRQWKTGDRIEATFDMSAQMLRANPLVREDTGRVAVQRGPIVYCIESPDQTPGVPLFDMALADTREAFREEFRSGLLDGVIVLRHRGAAAQKPLEDEPLYQAVAQPSRAATKPIELTFIPYYAWANRGMTSMEVWVPADQAGSGTR